jgi:hypothetical protein
MEGQVYMTVDMFTHESNMFTDRSDKGRYEYMPYMFTNRSDLFTDRYDYDM